MRKWIFIAAALALGVPVWQAAPAAADDDASTTTFVDEDGDGIDDRSAFLHHRGFQLGGRHGMTLSGDVLWTGTKLSDELQAAIKARADELKAAGATADEIKTATAAILAENGYTLPAAADWRLGRAGTLWTATAIPAEVQAEVKALVDGLKGQGKSMADIRAAAAALLSEKGYALSTDAVWRLDYSLLGRLSSVLTAEQLASLEARIDQLKADGATQREIMEEVRADLTAMGIEGPPMGAPMGGGPGGRGKGPGKRGR